MNNETISIKKGGTKPLVHLLPMMALLVFGMIALVGVVSADDAYKGLAPETVVNGVVNGGVNVLYNNTWSATNLTTDEASAHFNLSTNCSYDPSTDELEFARLYVVVYSGNMTANYQGTEDITLSNNGGTPISLADDQWLNLNYDKTQGIVYDNSVSKPPFVSLSRVTSDYLNIFDVKDNITSNNIVVNVSSTYQTGKYDGRIKEVKLVYGWNETGSSETTKYWINEGHDVVSKYDTSVDGLGNTTWFNGTGNPSDYNATLWIDYLGKTDGNYTLVDEDFSPTVIEQGGNYSGYSRISWNQSNYDLEENTPLHYDRSTNDWYKILVTVLTLK